MCLTSTLSFLTEAPKEEVAEADTAGQAPATEVSDEAAKAEGGDTEESATTTPKVAQTFFVGCRSVLSMHTALLLGSL